MSIQPLFVLALSFFLYFSGKTSNTFYSEIYRYILIQKLREKKEGELQEPIVFSVRFKSEETCLFSGVDNSMVEEKYGFNLRDISGDLRKKSVFKVFLCFEIVFKKNLVHEFVVYRE